MRCEAEWKEVVPRMGRWIDFEGGYKTMDTTYMEVRFPGSFGQLGPCF